MYQRFRASHVLAVLIALVPLAYLVRMAVLRSVDVPLWDEWQLALRLDHWYAGTLTVREFWEQHNEHRPMIPIAILTIMARITEWDVRWEIGANVVTGVGIFALYCVYLRRAWHAHGGTPVWLVPAVSALVFSTVQWENWLWGWQFALILAALFTIATSWMIAAGTENPRRFAWAIAFATCATYSFASGLTLWPSQLAGVWLAGGARRVQRTAVWLAAGAVVHATYFYHFERTYQGPMLAGFASLQGIRAMVIYFFVYLGAPVAGYALNPAAVAGGVGLVLFAALAIRLRAYLRDAVYLFPVLIGLQTIATACISAVGRIFLGPEQALSSRYTTLSLPFWCAIVFLATLWWRTAPVAMPWRWRALRAVTAGLVAGTLAVSAAKSAREGVYIVAMRAEYLMYARRGLLTGGSDTVLRYLLPTVDELRARRVMIMRRHLSVFRRSAQPSYPLPGPE